MHLHDRYLLPGCLLGLNALLVAALALSDANAAEAGTMWANTPKAITTAANRLDVDTGEVAAKSVCAPSDSAAEDLFSLAEERSDELTLMRIPVRADLDPGIVFGEGHGELGDRERDEGVIGISMNRDVFRSRLSVDEVRLGRDARALGVSALFCVEYRERAAALVVSNPTDALGPQSLSIDISRAGVRQKFVGRTPALPARASVPLLLDADEPFRSGGGPAHVVVVIGE